LDYTIVVGKGCLSTQLDIKNNSETDFDFTALLHTYIKVSDIKNVTVSGFEGCLFDDKVCFFALKVHFFVSHLVIFINCYEQFLIDGASPIFNDVIVS